MSEEAWMLPSGHSLIVGDVESGAADDLRLLTGVKEPGPVYDVCYTDPPWNAGIGRIFRRWAGVERPVDIDELLATTCRLIHRDVRGWALVQIGRQKVRRLEELVTQAGLVHRGTIECTQREESGREIGPAWLVACHRPDSAASGSPLPVAPEGAAWLDLCEAMLEQMTHGGGGGQSVVDWYMGQGMVMRVADRLGLRSYGLELNAHRAATAVERLNKDRKVGRYS